MRTQKDIPYGISDFRSLIYEKRYYIDRTNYIEKLENQSNKFVFFLRPRRFGKSLLISMMNYYYGVQYLDEFDSLFGNLYAGANPTELRNSYYVLNFEFSSINTLKIDDIMEEFNYRIKNGLKEFNENYKFLSRDEFDKVTDNIYPSTCFRNYLLEISAKLDRKIIVLIDEYDHFTNEILSFHPEYFSGIVSMNGFVRKFYEAIKFFTGKGVIDRFFATGITPVTLDSMTSGFNIATDISGEAEFNEIAGFTTAEVSRLIYDIFPGINEQKANSILQDAEKWYNGSLFSRRAKTKLYNSAMLLRFISKIESATLEYPEEMVDKNIISDYSKLSSLIELGNSEDNLEIINEILKTGTYASDLTQIFSFGRSFTKADFVSLLYYNGLLTIKYADEYDYILEIPNYVIKEVYWEFFSEFLRKNENIDVDIRELKNSIKSMANLNDILPLTKIVERILGCLSNRDSLKFDEKYIKLLYIVYVSLTNTYIIKSEQEVNKKYPDLLFFEKKTFHPKYQHLIELKYIKKELIQHLEKTKENAIEQVKGYMQLDELKDISNLKYWLIIFVGDSCSVCCEVV